MLVLFALWTAVSATPPEAPIRAMGVECHPFKGPPHGFRGPTQYPPSALRKREEGTVEFCIRIEANGRVGDCTILKSSGFADLDKGSCDLARSQFRFTPAHDDDGNPIPDGIKIKMNWLIPGKGL